MEQFAKNIKKFREERNLTQEEFGKIAGVSDKAVSTWENGTATPRMGALEKLANHFGVPKSYIIEGKESVSIDTMIAFKIRLLNEDCKKELMSFIDYLLSK